MSQVDNLILYFNKLHDTMDGRKTKLTRSTKSVHETSSSRVKRLITDLTEIKRPASKHRSTPDLSEKAQTLPRNFKSGKNGTRRQQSDYLKPTADDQKRIHKLSASGVQEKNDEVMENETITSIEQNFQQIKEQTEIEKIVEQFGDSLRQKRQQYAREFDEAITIEPIEEVEAFSCSSSTYISEESESSDSETSDILVESSDDMFGFNDFEEDDTDNYVLETYNKLGHELVKMTLQITRCTVNNNQLNNEVQNLIDSSDYVFHQSSSNYVFHKSEYDSSCSDETEKTDYSSHSSNFLYNTYVHQNLHNAEETEVLYDEVPYMSTIYDYSNNHKKEDETDHGFIPPPSNFSTSAEPIYVNGIDKSPSLSQSTEKKEKIQYIIEEMKKTEELYIAGLKIVVEDYIPYLEANTPRSLLGRQWRLFGNIEDIYKNAKKLYESMERSEDSVDGLAQIFIDSVLQFELYPMYSKNKPTADVCLKQFDIIVKERQRQLDDKLGLASYLLTPIQRLGKYVLLLEGIQKELKKADKPSEKVAAAISVVRNVMRKGNDYIAIDSIKNCDVDLTDKGSFIMRAPFSILKPRKFISMVFLFENIIVFTEKSYKNMEEFKYFDSIAMIDLSLGKFEEKPNIFHLTNYTKSKRSQLDATFVLEADTPKIKNEWTETIAKILWSQLKKAKEQQKKLTSTRTPHVAKTLQASRTKPSVKKPKSSGSLKKMKSKFYDIQYV